MAKVKFIVKGNQEIVQLIIRVSISRQNDFQKGSKIFIPKKYWNFEEKRLYDRKDKSSFKNDADFITTINNCNNLLTKIENYVVENLYNHEIITPLIIEDEILKFHGLPTNEETKIKINQERLLLNEINLNKLLNYIINYNQQRKNDSSITESTKQKYRYIESIIAEYESNIEKKLMFQDCNNEFFQNLINFLHDDRKLMASTIKRTIKNLKTILFDARSNGFIINSQTKISFKKSEKSDIIYLTFDELENLKDLNIESEELSNTRDWLIIGCYTGQRISDFMSFSNKSIRSYKDINGNSYEIIEIIQIKTQKRVAIPIHPYVKSIINKHLGFPPTFSSNSGSNSTIFNENLKKLLELANINRKVYAKDYDKLNKRNTLKLIPIHKAVSSHVCRRSFATNFYGNPNFPTPLIMSITGHTYEKTFLEYIGKKDINNALQVAKIFNG
ncbi:tyrosine-type recombinase/integrase [Empedobacter falsenii]|uniref:tyrosine-type recombinase/integrase n=1 Tax=Empedobacter falsenii TaxID=343874 RepID=UPI002577A6E6|nr:tyrosine-type recombinase/integrase [Empedobacter falsenii]MDM1548174.1 tyrosine-type recombinase/integrase [Empedobacter falsenii]